MSVLTTPHYGLKKPDGSESIKPDAFNDNAEVIDEQLHINSVLTGTAAPTTSTAGAVGQFYLDTAAKILYQCMTQGPVYTWKSVSREWKLLQAYTTAGSFTFTVPSGITEIGAFIIGGGGSGAADDYVNANFYDFCTGGGSGHTKTVIISGNLSASYPVVVGAGGAAISLSGGVPNYNNGNSGGSSSFAGITAAGGDKGQAYANGTSYGQAGAKGGQGSSGSRTFSTTPPAFGEVRFSPCVNGTLYSQGATITSECLNPFSLKRGLIAGGYAENQALSTLNSEGTNVTDDYGLVGSVGIATNTGGTVTKGTSYGCGGGAICSARGYAVTSGAGADGAVLIYGR